MSHARPSEHPRLPDRRTVEEAAKAARALVAALRAGKTPELTIPGAKGHGAKRVPVPREACDALAEALAHLAKGDGVTVVPIHPELTTQEAADVLHVSRPHLIELVEAGTLPHRMVGTHRRIPLEAVLKYRREMKEKTRGAVRELTKLSDELGLYDDTENPLRRDA